VSDSVRELDAEVIVVGGGPCGLVLACELGRRGIRTLLFNDRETTSPHPQANATQARTMEHYRRLGFARRIRAAGLPPDYPTDVAYFTRLSKHELARFELPAAGDADDLVRRMSGSWSAAELPHRCSQMYIERILREEAARFPSVTLRFGVRVLETADAGDHVSVTYRDGAAAPRQATARFLVGADGPRSETRRHLGIELRGEVNRTRPFLAGRMYSIFLRSTTLYDIIPWKRAWQYWVINPERRGALVALDGRSAFVYMTQLRPGEDDGPISEQVARHMVQNGVGCEFSFEIVERAPWTAGLTLCAERFQHGNVFLAGDAVHLFTPTGGLGYNTAVEDAVNLGWKLAAALRGWGGPVLLQSYEIEREPVAQRNLGFSRYYAESTGNFVVPSDLEDETDGGAAERRAVGDYFSSHARAEFDIPGVTFGARYDASPLIVPDGTTPPPDSANLYLPTASPGGRAPHAWLGDGRSLFDAFGSEFTLLRLGRHAPDAAPFIAAAEAARFPLSVLDLPSEEVRDIYETDFALIRPDQIVAWRGNQVAEPGRILAQVSGNIMSGHR
jgi:2-polyprenyl-6-methoxyphenol hydroxylase-like FAD-dependent oxidoreductase